jgi:integrase
MATLMAGIKGEDGKFYQKAIEIVKRRPVVPNKGEVITTAGGRTFTVGEVKRFFVLVRNSEGKQTMFGESHKNVEDAHALLAQVELLEKTGKGIEEFKQNATETTPGTWGALYTEYLDHLRLKVKKGTIKASSEKRYLRSLREFDAFLNKKGITSLKDVTTKIFENFKEFRIDAGAENAFVNDVKNLNPVFEYAVKQEMISRNPVVYENPKRDAERGAQPFSAAELKAMQNDEVLNGDKLTFWLLYQTGLRKGDAMDLRWSGVNGYITRVAQKNGKRVRIPILPELKATLDAERARRNPAPNEFVLLNPATNRPFTGNRIYDRLQTLGKRAGVASVHCHRFRDTFAADAFMRGCSTEEVAAYLGDDLKTVLKHYAEFVTERADRADEKLTSGKALLHVAVA